MDDDNKFSLGFEGETWYPTLHSLAIPISRDRDVLVAMERGEYIVYHTRQKNGTTWVKFDNLLMAACHVQSILDNYNGVEETDKSVGLPT